MHQNVVHHVDQAQARTILFVKLKFNLKKMNKLDQESMSTPHYMFKSESALVK